MLGYAYSPLILNESELEVQLQQLGAQSVHLDWGERHTYQQLKTQPPQTLILLRLIDLADSTATIATELGFWQAQGTEIIINGQSSRDPAHVQQWLIDLPQQLQSRRLAIAN
ncbi:MAG: hypothetical protein HC926_05930, partial [Synechococcaceae cyanobacterium SM2_3_60]|nr:hypothetical protein [Synechococcaceae cyanobacterium SM2_3_60]